ncbi:MAG: protein kinase [Fuerstiella sp.]
MASSDHDRVRMLFHEAVELQEEEQQRFLQQQCGDDQELLSSLQRLLVHHRPDIPLLEVEEARDQSQTASGTQALNSSLPPKFTPSGTKKFGDTMAEDLSGAGLGVLERQSQILSRTSRDRFTVVLLAMVLLCLLFSIAAWVYSGVKQSVRSSLQQTMQALLDEQKLAMRTWLSAEQRLAETWARSPEVAAAVVSLNTTAEQQTDLKTALQNAPAANMLQDALSRTAGTSGRYQFAVWNREGTLLADTCPEHADLLGNGTTEFGASLLSRVFHNQTVLWLPSRSGFISGASELSRPTHQYGFALITPVLDDSQKAIAALLVTSPEQRAQLEQLLEKARPGATGDTYAFGQDGYLITESRFSDQLKTVGLIDETPKGSSSPAVRVADPGGNLAEGYLPDRDRNVWPLTFAASSAVTGQSGSNFQGYRDYRGVPVVGVWTWLPEYRFGIATEVDYNAAFKPLRPLTQAFSIILGILLLAAIVGLGIGMASLKARRRATIDRIGPYTLRSLLGEGGFAHVYLASHALLKRPTAVKVLKPAQMNSRNLVRFEREVQLASSLTHPNTIGIYDYGSTADGRFYYAMEFIKGLSLAELIEINGPQCPERVVWILSQICRSLREAHNKGLIHRDIKPQNIMLCRRGGEPDTVKVLDFGLARNLDSGATNRVTETQLLIGTPLYIAPERIVDPTCMDPRSDIYSLGILGYFLLTGREPFEASDSMDALAQTMNRTARRPSEQSPSRLPDALDRLIRDCHSRTITERPESVEIVLQRLTEVQFEEPWSASRAAAWWMKHRINVSSAMERVAAVRSDRDTAPLPQPKL